MPNNINFNLDEAFAQLDAEQAEAEQAAAVERMAQAAALVPRPRGVQWLDFADGLAGARLRPFGGDIGLGHHREPAVAEVAEPMTYKTGEELFHLILSGIREIYEVEAVIAGGAVRDLAAGNLCPNDVDVFIPMAWEDFQQDVAQLGWAGPPYLVSKTGYENCVIPSTARANACIQDVGVDLVFTKKPLTEKGIKSFPFHTQRCSWTLKDGLVITPEAQEDINNKTFTIDPTITDRNKIAELVKKGKGWLGRAFYKDWEVVTPVIKDWWEE